MGGHTACSRTACMSQHRVAVFEGVSWQSTDFCTLGDSSTRRRRQKLPSTRGVRQLFHLCTTSFKGRMASGHLAIRQNIGKLIPCWTSVGAEYSWKPQAYVREHLCHWGCFGETLPWGKSALWTPSHWRLWFDAQWWVKRAL